ncbi:MAG: carbohydrate ABC transporter permease [Clostridiaceae bacterium]|nr:carbohydrate ABC transporter permease [Clostridiaceae bacterium]
MTRKSHGEKVFDTINNTILALILIIVAYPLYFVVIASISDPIDVALGRVILIPSKIVWDGYKKILAHKDLWIGYKNTFTYTILGTLLNLSLTLTSAYSLSRKDMPGRNLFMGIFTFTMFFGGGLIPTYLLVKSLNLIDTYAVMIVLGAVSVWNVIIARTFFQSTIPQELLEAAIVDGCNDFLFFFRIVLPLSKAIIAVLTIYYAVGHWNQFFNAIIYLRNRNKYPLQLFLREILIQNQFNEEMQIMDDNALIAQTIAMSMKYGVIIVSSLPVLILYPFLQKYFMKGVMIGSIKG